MDSSDLLRAYLQALCGRYGAVGGTLYAPAAGGAGPAIHLHVGELPPAPALADVDSGERLQRELERRGSESEGVPGPCVFPSGSESNALIHVPGPIWIGLCFEAPRRLDHVDSNDRALLELAGNLIRFARSVSTILRDPVTGLPGRTEFQAGVEQALGQARRRGTPLALLLANPDEFASINERFGREAGDTVIRHVARRLESALRRPHLVAKYGGAIFGILLPETSPEGAREAAEKILERLRGTTFLDGAVRLGFSLGVAMLDPAREPLEGIDLVRRADQALNAAKRKGGSRIAVWTEQAEAEELGSLDQLGGIFTGNMSKDYRNMVLLWDSVTVIAAHPDFEELAGRVVDRLAAALKPDRVGIFGAGGDGAPQVIRALGPAPESGGGEAQSFDVNADQIRLMERARVEQRPVEETLRGLDRGDPEQEMTAYAIPLSAGPQDLGWLYLDGPSPRLSLDPSDLFFLRALAAQLAVALDRARLAEQERLRQAHERTRLRAELEDLRRGIQRAKLEYRSAEIDAVLATARRVAPTDATVLITGESGTGKELLARTVHELSGRRDRPLVVVDCGAIATSLVDSELFGHERGAYTGADGRKIGRLAEADGATVLLDEIGELPLEVQAKLLRFVQEKQVTPVGGTKQRSVDVRVIAATNRDLAAEVASGRFREDLYHRLNVVRLVVPPLRERPDDILHLAHHYLQLYAALYKKDVQQLAPDCRAELLRHAWPGNVRELQNRMMQAVILCQGEELTPRELGLDEETPRTDAAGESTPARPAASPPASGPWETQLERLRSAVADQIEAAVGDGSHLALPIGRWLLDDLVLEADAVAEGVTRAGARLLGVPATTFRRRLRQAGALAGSGMAPRPNTWPIVQETLKQLVRCAPVGTDLLECVQRVLLEEIVARVSDDMRTGAALLGVTPPTYQRRLSALRAS